MPSRDLYVTPSTVFSTNMDGASNSNGVSILIFEKILRIHGFRNILVEVGDKIMNGFWHFLYVFQ